MSMKISLSEFLGVEDLTQETAQEIEYEIKLKDEIAEFLEKKTENAKVTTSKAY